MKKHVVMLFTTLGAVLSLVGSSRALIGGGDAFVVPEAMQLIERPDVQHELDLNIDQIGKARSLASSYRTKMREDREQLKGLDPEQRQVKRQEMKKYDELSEQRIGEILNPPQVTRLGEISLQQLGATALMAPKIIGRLDLGDDQRVEIQAIVRDSNRQRSEILKTLKDKPEESKRKLSELKAETLARAVHILAEEQRKKWTELLGTPFHVELTDEGG